MTSFPSRPSVIFVDRLGLAALVRLLAAGRSARTVWYFEPLGSLGSLLVRWLRRTRLLPGDVRQVRHNMGSVRDGSGRSELDRLWGAVRDVCTRIRDERTLNDPLVRKMASIWGLDNILLYLDKKIERHLRDECFRVGLVEWMARTQSDEGPAGCALVVERGRWHSYTADLARSRGIDVLSYPDPWRWLVALATLVLGAFKRGRSLAWALAVGIPRRAGKLSSPFGPSRSTGPGAAEGGPAVGIRHYARTLSLDPGVRSELFWLQESGIPYSNVLVYDYKSDRPIDDATWSALKARGVRVYGRAPGVPRWRSTWRVIPVAWRAVRPLVTGLLSCWMRGRWVSPYYAYELAVLAADHSYWYDFYAANRVRLNVSAMLNMKVSQVLALDSLGAVTASYQYSTSLTASSSLLYAGEDVVFVFSPTFGELMRRTPTPVKEVVPVGFVDDGAIRHLMTRTSSQEVRAELEGNGARFILAYFDENSADRWNSYSSNGQAASDYEFLLRWLLDDPSLGIVFKPKNAPNLLQRVHSVRELMDQATATGRCRFLLGDTIIGGIFPAEAAMASDASIGRPTTAALEARLAGVRSLMIDVQGFRDPIYHSWGRGTAIFDDWPSLREAVERYRADPDGCRELGDWSPGIHRMDPFGDGNAGRRIGLYTGLIYRALQRGANKAESLSEAGETYAAQTRSPVGAG